MPLAQTSRAPHTLALSPCTAAGSEVAIDARDCAPALLRSQPHLAALFDEIIADLDLRPIGQLWHVFPEPGGVTGLVLLTESHLTVHTFPESGHAIFNLYCCRPRLEWPWDARLRLTLGARQVRIRSCPRG